MISQTHFFFLLVIRFLHIVQRPVIELLERVDSIASFVPEQYPIAPGRGSFLLGGVVVICADVEFVRGEELDVSLLVNLKYFCFLLSLEKLVTEYKFLENAVCFRLLILLLIILYVSQLIHGRLVGLIDSEVHVSHDDHDVRVIAFVFCR